MYDLFLREVRPDASTTIVDIGVSDEETDEANMLEKLYPYTDKITCAGIGTGTAILKAYPGIRFEHVEPGQPLPFRDRQFDIAYSNAVLEHVGGRDQRSKFILGALRVAKAVFIAVPNRWFPIEHHTGLPLLHFAPGLFRSVLSGTRYEYWSKPENVEFLDMALLRNEWPVPTRSLRIIPTGINLGWFSSNLAIIAT
jgi:SAM-dependent methyltransferase